MRHPCTVRPADPVDAAAHHPAAAGDVAVGPGEAIGDRLPDGNGRRAERGESQAGAASSRFFAQRLTLPSRMR